jgi:DeoR family glycerol-3-phosphate regulon repressor
LSGAAAGTHGRAAPHPTILDFDAREVHVTRSIIRNARSTILVADAMKFERNAPVRIANVGEIDHVITDPQPPTTFIELCQRERIGVHLAV